MSKKYVSIDKRSKKEQKSYYFSRRGSWEGVKPYTRVFAEDGKFTKAKRSRDKADLKRSNFGDANGRPLFCWRYVPMCGVEDDMFI